MSVKHDIEVAAVMSELAEEYMPGLRWVVAATTDSEARELALVLSGLKVLL
jgi:hypothetical protein